jgi:hypothetical protein
MSSGVRIVNKELLKCWIIGFRLGRVAKEAQGILKYLRSKAKNGINKK